MLQLGLSRRDHAVQTGESYKAFAALAHLGEDFEKANDLQMARHFRESALQASSALHNADVAEAHGALGLVLEKQGNLPGASEQLQAMRGVAEDTTEACNHLVRVTLKSANANEGVGDMAGSLNHLLVALELAHEANNEEDITITRFRLGRVYATLGDAHKAIENLEKYMDAASNDAEGMNRAFEVLATCYEKLDDLERAAGYLERLVETSTRVGQMSIASHAAARLGDIFSSTGELVQSVHWYNHAFNTARDLADLVWITKCQIQLGRARAAAMTTGFQECLSKNKMLDVVRLLMWKSHREESFSDESASLGFIKPGTAVAQSADTAAIAAKVAALDAAAAAEGAADVDAEDGEADAPPGGDGGEDATATTVVAAPVEAEAPPPTAGGDGTDDAVAEAAAPVAAEAVAAAAAAAELAVAQAPPATADGGSDPAAPL
jgi:tetratricopeptide (TPR) repeat protein